jgi:hypothetical protein
VPDFDLVVFRDKLRDKTALTSTCNTHHGYYNIVLAATCQALLAKDTPCTHVKAISLLLEPAVSGFASLVLNLCGF